MSLLAMNACWRGIGYVFLLLTIFSVQEVFGSERKCNADIARGSGQIVSLNQFNCFSVEKRKPQKIRFPIVVESESLISVASKLTGIVKEIYIEEGQLVKQGVDLLLIDSPEQEQDVRSSLVKLNSYEKKYKKALHDYNRFSKLYKKGSISNDQIETASLEKEIAFANYNVARTQFDSAKKLSLYRLIKAPFDAKVDQVIAKKGQLSIAGAQLVILRRPKEFVFKGELPASYINEVSSGQTISIFLDQRKIPSVIVYVAGYIDLYSQTVEVKLVPKQSTGDILTGNIGYAEIQLSGAPKGGFLIPKEAIIFDSGMYGVFLLDSEGRKYFQWIDKGKQYEEMVEVFSGLNAGDLIVY